MWDGISDSLCFFSMEVSLTQERSHRGRAAATILHELGSRFKFALHFVLGQDQSIWGKTDRRKKYWLIAPSRCSSNWSEKSLILAIGASGLPQSHSALFNPVEVQTKVCEGLQFWFSGEYTDGRDSHFNTEPISYCYHIESYRFTGLGAAQ